MARMEEMLARRTCEGCLKQFDPSKLKKCSGCHVTQYCSTECQRSQWKSHKSLCVQNKAVVNTVEELSIRQPYEIVFKEQFKKFCDAMFRQFTGAAAQAYGLRADGVPQPQSGNSTDGRDGPLPRPPLDLFILYFSFDLREKDLQRQFTFLGGATTPLKDFQARKGGYLGQETGPLAPNIFSQDWLNDEIGMARLPAEEPRIPMAVEAHFCKETWHLTGHPSFSAQHVGFSTRLAAGSAIFPAPPPETWVRDLGDRLKAMQQVGWKEKREIRTTKVKKEMKEQLVPVSLPEDQFERFWRLRQNFQAFYGLYD